MRVIEKYSFELKSKVRLYELTDRVHLFLDGQGLSYRRFYYYLMNLIHSFVNNEPSVKKCPIPCVRAASACPALGSVAHYIPYNPQHDFEKYYFSNIIDSTDCTENDILPYLGRIERTYGIDKADLYYCDVDFFGRTTQCERDFSSAKGYCEKCNIPFDERIFLNDQLFGSMIRIHRSFSGSGMANSLYLSVDAYHDGEYHIAEGYCKAMAELLPEAKPRREQFVYLSDAEKEAIDKISAEEEELLSGCRGFLKSHIPGSDRQNMYPSNYNIAPVLKRLAKANGYDYTFIWNGVYSLKKRMPRGHFMKIITDSDPSHYDTSFTVFFEGLGFSHRLYDVMFTPHSQSELNECAETFFNTMREFEAAYLPVLNALYDETPEWFCGGATW